MKLPSSTTEEHAQVRCRVVVTSFHRGNRLDFLEFRVGLDIVPTVIATKPPENVSRFFLAANLDKPSWRFREEPDHGEEAEKRDDLEADREPPSDW